MPYFYCKNGEAGFKVSNYVKSAKDLKPGARVIKAKRVSGRAQQHNGNLQDQGNHLDAFCKTRQLKEDGSNDHVGSGANPEWLGIAAYHAKMENAVLLIESPDRALRSPKYHSQKNPSAVPTQAAWEALKEILNGVEIYSVQDPDSTFSEQRSEQTKRGLRRGKRGSYSKPNRDAVLSQLVLLREQGNTLEDIAWIAMVSKRTVCRWLKLSKAKV